MRLNICNAVGVIEQSIAIHVLSREHRPPAWLCFALVELEQVNEELAPRSIVAGEKGAGKKARSLFGFVAGLFLGGVDLVGPVAAVIGALEQSHLGFVRRNVEDRRGI